MKFVWGLFVLCLFYLVTASWGGKSFNPATLTHMSKKQGPSSGVLTPDAVQSAFDSAAKIIESRRSLAGQRRNLQPRSNSAEARHQGFLASRPRSRELARVHEKFEEATRVLFREFNLTPEQIRYELPNIDLKSMVRGDEVEACEALFNVRNCDRDEAYRTYDGTCNNLRNPSWGMASSCFQRLVDPDYADGIAEKRVAMSGNELPNPRRVSLEIHSRFQNPAEHVNHLFMVWGQFLDHDIALTPVSRGPNNEQLDCCPIMEDNPPNCDPVRIEENDPFFIDLNINCLSNVRSEMCTTCTLGPHQQINQVTSYIDASHIYGMNQNESRGLRSNDGSGTLRSVTVNGAGELPPGSFTPNEDQCSGQDPILDCFETGDQRANQHPALTSLHVIFLREHNRIARSLREINPTWNDERLYQEARRIVGAEMQMVTYSEFLPLVIGNESMKRFALGVRPINQFTQYDETVQAALVNEFSTAAYRFGHSMINSFFRNSRGRGGGYFLRDMFTFPFGLYNGEMDGVVEGLVAAPSQNFDRYMVRDVTNHLYQIRGNASGMDLASLNVNRGRDHGIPGYTTLLEFCGGPRITAWPQLDELFQTGVRPLFENLYERVEDIDLFSGGLAEKPYQGAVIGPTFTCIVGIQFQRLKYGDRFYFEHGEQSGSFTPAQLQELKKVTLGKIICDNSRVSGVPDNSFLFGGKRNPTGSCEGKPAMDLNTWRE